MRELFTDLYNKVAKFFQAAEEKENIKEVACNRLKFVLMQDRTNLTPHLLERMRGELVDLLSKYVEMDKEALELNFAQEGDSMALMLSIPVIRAKEEEEIQAILDAEDKAKADAEAQEISEEEESEETDENADDVEAEPSEKSEETEEAEACSCSSECECGCQEGEPCTCAEEEASEPKPQPAKKSRKNKQQI